MVYFAYGSNMFTYSLEKRIGKVDYLGIGKLTGFKFEISKKSIDGSLKANALQTGNHEDHVLGIIFQINPSKQHLLDKAEGLGYGYLTQDVEVESLRTHEMIHAFTYIASTDQRENEGLPYDWYLKLIISGADEHHLPENYITFLKSHHSKEDLNQGRRDTELFIFKESLLIKKNVAKSIDRIYELNKNKQCTIELFEHALDNRKIVIEKTIDEFKFKTDSKIPKGLQTHKELNVSHKTLVLNDGKQKWYIEGKHFIITNLGYDFDNALKIISGSINSLSSSSIKNTEQIFRLIIPVKNRLKIIEDYECLSFLVDYKIHTGLLNLSIHNNIFHLFSIPSGENKFLMIDCLQKIKLEEFQRTCNSILMTYALLSGEYFAGEGYYLSFEEDSMIEPVWVLYHSLGRPIDNLSRVFTTNAYIGIDVENLKRDQKGIITPEERQKLYADIKYFPAAVFSQICQFSLTEEKILRTLILLMNNQSSRLEVKIPMQYIAIETITACIAKESNKKLKPIQDDNLASLLIEQLKRKVESFAAEYHLTNSENLSTIIKKLNSLNSPANVDKLSRSFEILGYSLTKEEIQILKHRDKFLHGGILSFETIDDGFKELLYLSLRLHFLIAVLVLKKVGFQGRIINYAKLYEHITDKYLDEKVLKKI